MKNLICILFLVGICNSVCGQFLFDAGNLPVPNMVIRYKVTKPGSYLSQINAGQNQNWTISLPDAQADSIRVSWKEKSEAPGNHLFPNANIVCERIFFDVTQSGNVYTDTTFEYYRKSEKGLYFIEKYRRSDVTIYPVKREYLQLACPMEAGSVIRDTSDAIDYYKIQADSFKYKSRFITHFQGHASGLLSINGKTHQVVYVKRNLKRIDSTFKFEPVSGTWVSYLPWTSVADRNLFVSPGLGSVVMSGSYESSENGPFWLVEHSTNNPVLTRIPAMVSEHTFKIFPNPNNGIFRLEGILANSIIRIFDQQGRIYKSFNSEDSPPELEFLPEGIYRLQWISGQGQFYAQKNLVIRR